MNGVRTLCGECFSDKANHSATLETIKMSSDDRKYVGMPVTRTCDKCHVVVSYRSDPTTQQEGEDAEREASLRDSLYEYKYPGTNQGIRLTDAHVEHLMSIILDDRKTQKQALRKRIEAQAPKDKETEVFEQSDEDFNNHCGFNDANAAWRAAIRKASGNE